MFDNKQSEAFLAVAEYGSFEQAARALCLTASAISLRVQALEKKFGQVLIVRGKPLILTTTGQALLIHLQHLRLQEQNLLQTLSLHSAPHSFIAVTLGVNADSLAIWLLPYLHSFLKKEKILLSIKLDDQTETHELLFSGVVNACISVEAKAMKGCESLYLGEMTYRMMAHPDFIAQYFPKEMHREAFRIAPAVIFNQKDHLHDTVLTRHFGLIQGSYPCHFIPSSHDFAQMIHMGLAYGLLPEWQIQQLSSDLVDLMPEYPVKVPLYWHCWKQQPDYLHRMTQHLLTMSKAILNS